MRKKKLNFSVICCGLLVAFLANPYSFAAPLLEEYEVKAAFLYQFTKFIEWPAEKSSPIVTLCIYGKDPFGGVIDQLERENANSSTLHVQRIQNGGAIDSCHMIFLGSSEKRQVKNVVQMAQGRKLVTVSEVPGFIQKGGIINFIRQGKNIRFEINQKQAETEGIKISSKLLKLASQVITP